MTKYISIGRVTDDFETFKRDLLTKYPVCQVYRMVKGRVFRCQVSSEDLDHCLMGAHFQKLDMGKPCLEFRF